MVGQINGSVLKAFQILSLFHEGRDEISSAVLADRLQMSTVTAHRFLRTLEKAGALVASSKGSYRLGYVLADLGERTASLSSLENIVQDVLDGLTRRVGEASLATTFDGEMAVCFAKSVPDRPLFVDVKRGSRLEAYCSAHGKLWLAELSATKMEQYLSSIERRPLTDTTIVDQSSLLESLGNVREQSVAFNRQERDGDINAVAVPVRSRTGRMVCGLSVFGASSRLTEKAMKDFVEPLREAAREVERRLYGSLERSFSKFLR